MRATLAELKGVLAFFSPQAAVNRHDAIRMSAESRISELSCGRIGMTYPLSKDSIPPFTMARDLLARLKSVNDKTHLALSHHSPSTVSSSPRLRLPSGAVKSFESGAETSPVIQPGNTARVRLNFSGNINY